MYVGAHCNCRKGMSGDVGTALLTGAGSAAGAATTGLAVAAAAGGPIGAAVGGAIFAVNALIGLIFGKSKTGIEKEKGTQVVNQAEPLLKQNLAAWKASGKTIAEQQQALANFDQIWAQVVAGCQQNSPDVSSCYTDRQRGGKWDWFAYYRDPIANDPGVKQGVFSQVGVDTGAWGLNWGLVAGIGLIGFALMMGDKK